MNITATTLKEDNILIAEFMGMKQGKSNETRWKKDWFEILTVSGNIFESGRRHEYLHFDTSWDWLMPVIEKIETIEEYRFDFEIRQSLCEIYDKDEQEDLFQETGDTKIEVTYRTALLFIKWYNTKN